MRKSGKPDLRGRRSNLGAPHEIASPRFARLAMTRYFDVLALSRPDMRMRKSSTSATAL
jgi:hypothetical protein